MPIVRPPAPRSRIEEDGATLRITIPSQKQLYLIVFMSVWLIPWALGELTVGGIIVGGLTALLTGNVAGAPGVIPALAGGGLFLLVWFIGWTVGGLWALYVWLWQVSGK